MDYIKINPSDNVAVVLKDLVKGEAVEGVTLSTDVPRGHKVLLRYQQNLLQQPLHQLP